MNHMSMILRLNTNDEFFHFQIGFRLNNKVSIIGPICIFPRTVLSWNVESVDDIDEHSLRLLLALEPKLELLIIGTGDTEVTPEIYRRIQKITKTYDIRVEILKTEAVSLSFKSPFKHMFNFVVIIWHPGLFICSFSNAGSHHI